MIKLKGKKIKDVENELNLYSLGMLVLPDEYIKALLRKKLSYKQFCLLQHKHSKSKEVFDMYKIKNNKNLKPAYNNLIEECFNEYKEGFLAKKEEYKKLKEATNQK